MKPQFLKNVKTGVIFSYTRELDALPHMLACDEKGNIQASLAEMRPVECRTHLADKSVFLADAKGEAGGFLRNLRTGVVFPWTDALSRRPDLAPCDENGNLFSPADKDRDRSGQTLRQRIADARSLDDLIELAASANLFFAETDLAGQSLPALKEALLAAAELDAKPEPALIDLAPPAGAEPSPAATPEPNEENPPRAVKAKKSARAKAHKPKAK